MIPEFVVEWEKNKESVRAYFRSQHPKSYIDIVRETVRALEGHNESEFYHIDSTRIHQIDDGEYQGMLLFLIASSYYPPSNYWYVRVNYGSCGGCDTLQSIKDQSNYDTDGELKKPSEQQVDDYMTLALHIVQGLKKLETEDY